jgi:V/A-type H+-transporting ATPase subunit A
VSSGTEGVTPGGVPAGGIADRGEGDRHGSITRVGGPVARARVPPGVAIGEVALLGPRRLLGEVIHLAGQEATIEVYEETAGLGIGDPVTLTGAPLVAWLGPGLLGRVIDGLQRPLDTMASAGTWLLRPGSADRDATAVLGAGRAWGFQPTASVGDRLGAGDVVGEIAEGPLRHRILVPPAIASGVLVELRAGPATVADEIGRLETPEGTVPLRLAHAWPVRRPRPVARRGRVQQPLVTGQRVIDMLFPLARGGTAVIPGGFGTGKTVLQQQLARWADADIVVYVGCGERGNEMAELLDTFPALVDPRTGQPLMARTVLIANTSNMPVAAREASVQLGMTIAEYFRDQGLGVALLADSTSRWAEALREISGRLEELPGEEGYPAYLGSRLASFYERAGSVTALGTPERSGSVTLVGAVSPPGGDLSEPVTQASLRLAGTFWALDATLAHARHFPAIGWDHSWSLYTEALAPWYAANVAGAWAALRGEALALLAHERELLAIVALVGTDALPDHDRATLEVARLLRETFLQQAAYDPADSARSPDEQVALLEAVLAAGRSVARRLEAGASVEDALDEPAIRELRRAREWTGSDVASRLRGLATRLVGAPPPAASPGPPAPTGSVGPGSAAP